MYTGCIKRDASLFVLGTLGGLVRDGLVTATPSSLTGKGLDTFAQMQNDGYAVDCRDTVKKVLAALAKQRGTNPPDQDLIDLTAFACGCADWDSERTAT